MILFPYVTSTGVLFIMDVFKICCEVRNEFLNLILKIELINKEFVIDSSVENNNLASTECQVFGSIVAPFCLLVHSATLPPHSPPPLSRNKSKQN
jgi:hypothetical protein